MIDLEAALGEFGDKSTQGEVPCPGALQQPGCSPENAFGLFALVHAKATLLEGDAAVSRTRRIQTITLCRRPCRIAPRSFVWTRFLYANRRPPRIRSGAGPGSGPGAATDQVRGRAFARKRCGDTTVPRPQPRQPRAREDPLKVRRPHQPSFLTAC
jgi:hypothetical protein